MSGRHGLTFLPPSASSRHQASIRLTIDFASRDLVSGCTPLDGSRAQRFPEFSRTDRAAFRGNRCCSTTARPHGSRAV